MKRMMLILSLLGFVPAAQAQVGMTQCAIGVAGDKIESLIDTELLLVRRDSSGLVITPAPMFAEVYYHELVHKMQIQQMGCAAAMQLSPEEWAVLEVKAYCVSLFYALQRGADREERLWTYSGWIANNTETDREEIYIMLKETC